MLFDGAIWEILGLIALVYMYLHQRKKDYYYSFSYKDSKFFYFVIVVVALYVIMQVLQLKLEPGQIIRLYGISKTTFALPIVYLCLRGNFRTESVVRVILPFILMVNWTQIVYLISDIEMFNILNGRANYLGCIDLLFLPFVLKLDRTIPKMQRRIFLLTFAGQLLLSGSRSVMLVSVVVILGVFLSEKDIKVKLRYCAFLALAFVGLAFVATSSDLVTRALSVFIDRSDAAREGLFMFAQRQFDGYTELEKVIGNGDVLVISQNKPVHNFFWELLLCYGKLGVALWLSYILIMVILIIKRRPRDWYFIILETMCVFVIGYVQPFMTTGFLFQFVVAVTIFQIYLSEADNKTVETI